MDRALIIVNAEHSGFVPRAVCTVRRIRAFILVLSENLVAADTSSEMESLVRDGNVHLRDCAVVVRRSKLVHICSLISK
jgi:hypothetical protein